MAWAAYEFILGPLLSSPQRVGKALHEPLEGRHSARRADDRVVYRIDETARTVTVLDVSHRRDAYRNRG